MTNVIDFNKRRQEQDDSELEKFIKNPMIHALANVVYEVRDDGALLNIYQKPSDSAPFDTWTLKYSGPCDPIVYHTLINCSVLEQKIFVLRDKYEPETINMDKPPSHGLPTGVDAEGNPTGYTE